MKSISLPVQPAPLVYRGGISFDIFSSVVATFFGRLLALALLIVLLPLLMFVSIAIWMTDGGPIFFRHERLGRGGKSFGCLKFRTMVTDADIRLGQLLKIDPSARREWERDQKLRFDPRVTFLGRYLRKSSIDELPQLWNVIVGEMNFVGPRPIVFAEAAHYGRYLEHYFRVAPGITGLWQVSGRNDTSYRRRVAMDVAYVRRRNFGMNAWILAATLPAVLLGSGSY